MPIDLGNGKAVLSMTLIDISNGKELTLFERESSKCHFHEDIYFGDYIVTLRIDWGDIQNTDPVMDADIYLNDSMKKGKKIKNGSWHHTVKKFDENENKKVYDFTFRDLRLRLSARMNFSLSLGMGAIIVRREDLNPKA